MGKVTIELPSVLDVVVDGNRTLSFDAETLPEALVALTERYPGLAVHLFDETG